MVVQAQAGSDLRGLKALVGFLGVLIVIGTAVVIGVVIKRIYGTSPVAASISSPVPGVAEVPVTALAPGEHIAGIAGAGGEFAVWVSGARGDRLLLLNPQTGVLSTVLQPPP
jgi:hypothetical protein